MDPLIPVHQQLGQLEGKVSAAHNRLDRHESVVQKYLEEIKADIRSISTSINNELKLLDKELRTIQADMNTRKGWGAGALFVAGIAGSLLGTLASILLK